MSGGNRTFSHFSSANNRYKIRIFDLVSKWSWCSCVGRMPRENLSSEFLNMQYNNKRWRRTLFGVRGTMRMCWWTGYCGFDANEKTYSYSRSLQLHWTALTEFGTRKSRVQLVQLQRQHSTTPEPSGCQRRADACWKVGTNETAQRSDQSSWMHSSSLHIT